MVDYLNRIVDADIITQTRDSVLINLKSILIANHNIEFDSAFETNDNICTLMPFHYICYILL